MSVDKSKVEKGDRVKVSLYGLPESDWLEVADVFFCAWGDEVALMMPDGDQPLFPVEWITAHEPAAPELPDWADALVVRDELGVLYGRNCNGWSLIDADGHQQTTMDLLVKNSGPVSVVVDRDGNQPAAEGYRRDALTEIQNRRIVEAERNKARADLAAFRAGVLKVRDDVRYLFDYQTEQRLDAILDGADQ